MKKTLLIIALIYVNIIVFATTARITIHMSDQATGFLTLYAPVNGNWQQVYHEDNHQYQQGENIIVINASFDLGETISPYLNYDAWTSWGAGYTNEINLSYQIYQGNEIYGGSDYCSFWYPKDMKVFIKPNTDVVAPVIKLYSPNAYGGDDHLEGTINNINLQPNVWNEVIFQDVVPYGTTGYFGPNDDDYKNCYATFDGLSQYGQPLHMQTSSDFTYNQTDDCWENSDLEVNFNLYHNFKETVTTNVDINNAVFKLKDPNGNEISSQTVNVIGNHPLTINFDNMLNPNGSFNPADYKLYYSGTSIVNETLTKENTNSLQFDANTGYWTYTHNLTYTQDSEIRQLHTGWNWIGFPRLSQHVQELTFVLDPATPQFNEIQYIRTADTYYTTTYTVSDGWQGGEFPLYSLVRTYGYKIQMNSDKNLYVLGQREESTSTVLLTTAHENWITYWLPNTVKWDVALTGQLDHITSIKAEDWFVYKKSGRWYGMVGLNGATFEYGKTYVITVDQSFHLHWFLEGPPSDPYQKEEAEHFEYEEKSDYQMIEVESIEDGENVEEIGVFQGDKCIGASKVTEFPVHIMAYSDQFTKEDELSFEIITSNKSKKSYNTVLSYNFEKEKYETKNLHANQEPFMLIKLVKSDNEQTPQATSVTVSNYPNPFNPETTISYHLPSDSNVSLSVYNLKGKLVKTLFKGSQLKGDYKTIWDGTDNNDRKVTSGVYFYRLDVNGKIITKKMVLLK